MKIKGNETVCIYALINPITNHIFYVGASIQPDSRLKQHVSGRNFGDTYKNQQIKEIVNSELKVELLILEECHIKDSNFL